VPAQQLPREGQLGEPEGGGTFESTNNNCTLAENTSWEEGGGAHNSTLNNCVVTGNSARYYGAEPTRARLTTAW